VANNGHWLHQSWHIAQYAWRAAVDLHGAMAGVGGAAASSSSAAAAAAPAISPKLLERLALLGQLCGLCGGGDGCRIGDDDGVASVECVLAPFCEQRPRWTTKMVGNAPWLCTRCPTADRRWHWSFAAVVHCLHKHAGSPLPDSLPALDAALVDKLAALDRSNVPRALVRGPARPAGAGRASGAPKPAAGVKRRAAAVDSAAAASAAAAAPDAADADADAGADEDVDELAALSAPASAGVGDASAVASAPRLAPAAPPRLYHNGDSVITTNNFIGKVVGPHMGVLPNGDVGIVGHVVEFADHGRSAGRRWTEVMLAAQLSPFDPTAPRNRAPKRLRTE